MSANITLWLTMGQMFLTHCSVNIEIVQCVFSVFQVTGLTAIVTQQDFLSYAWKKIVEPKQIQTEEKEERMSLIKNNNPQINDMKKQLIMLKTLDLTYLSFISFDRVFVLGYLLKNHYLSTISHE